MSRLIFIFCCNLGQDIGHREWVFMVPSSVLVGKSRDSSLIRLWTFPPKFFPIHYSTNSLPFLPRCWQNCQISHVEVLCLFKSKTTSHVMCRTVLVEVSRYLHVPVALFQGAEPLVSFGQKVGSIPESGLLWRKRSNRPRRETKSGSSLCLSVI